MLYRSLALMALLAASDVATAAFVSKDCCRFQQDSALSMLPSSSSFHDESKRRRETSLGAHTKKKINEFSGKEKWLAQSMGLFLQQHDPHPKINEFSPEEQLLASYMGLPYEEKVDAVAVNEHCADKKKQHFLARAMGLLKRNAMKLWTPRDANKLSTAKKKDQSTPNVPQLPAEAQRYLDMAKKQSPKPLVPPEVLREMEIAEKLKNVNNGEPSGMKYSKFMSDIRNAERMMSKTKVMMKEQHQHDVLVAEEMWASTNDDADDWDLDTCLQ